jgi:hypothetical protein
MSKKERMVTAIVCIAVLLSVIVWLLRISSAVTLDRPFLGGTSGCEEEALFSVWKAANCYEVYNNPWLPPFSASYFGWLFYEVYGLWAKAGLIITGLDDAWLPTFTRFLTLLGLLGCIGIYYRLLQFGTNQFGTLSRILLLGFSALVFINPLFHWWSFTTRADIWALFWELAALLAAFHYAQSGRLRSVVLVGVCAFLAWSFRQTNISVLAGFGLWLLFDGRWRVLLVMVPSMAVAFGLTMGLLGMNFIDSAFTANALSGEMLGSVAWDNAVGALTKDPLFALSLVFVSMLVVFSRGWRGDSLARLCLLAAAVASVSGAVFSAKAGASSNYYFPAAALVPLSAWILLHRADLVAWIRPAFLGVAALGMAISSGLVLAGVSGNLRIPSDQRSHDFRALQASLPKPVFCTDRTVNLPWILGDGADSYVFGFAYQRMLAARPEMFVRGTIAERLQTGYFGSVLLADANVSYEPASGEMSGYREVRRVDGGSVWLRVER